MKLKFLQALKDALKFSDLWRYVSPNALDSMYAHFELMLEWNKAYSLTAITSPADAAIKLYADSLAALPLLHSVSVFGDVLDVGSGAGFPGIPLAITYPNRRFALVERNGKKSAFLRFAVRSLNLTHRVSVLNVGIDEKTFPNGDWSVVLSKATFSDLSWVNWTRGHIKSDGVVLLFITEDKFSLANGLGFNIKNRFDYALPNLNKQRSVIMIQPVE